MVELIVSSVLSFVFGGGVIAFLQYKRDAKKDDQSFFEKELEHFKKENYELGIRVRFLESRLIEPPVIRWQKVNGKFTYVSNECMLKILGPLDIRVQDVLGHTAIEVFKEHKDLLKQLTLLEAKARKKGKSEMSIEIPGGGSYLTFQCMYLDRDNGVGYECSMYEKTKENETV